MNIKKYKNLYKEFIKPFIFEEIICSVFLAIYSLTNILYPYFLKLIIDDAIGKNDIKKLIIYTIIMIMVIIIMVITRYLQSIKFLKLGQKVMLKVKETIINKLMTYSQTFFRSYKNGEIVSIIENDVKSVNRLATYLLSDIVINIITAIGLFTILCTMNSSIAICSIFLVIMYTYFQKKYGGKTREKAMKLSRGMGLVTSQTQELIENINDIKLLNIYDIFKEKYRSANNDYFVKEQNLVKLNIRSGILGTIFQSLGLLIVLCFGGYMVLEGNMTLGILFSLTIYIQRIYSPIISLANSYLEIKKTQASLNRIYNLINNYDEVIKEGKLSGDIPLKGSIELRNFSYGYENDLLIKQGNVKMEPGDKIAIIGSNGSGKTTLMRLLLRMQEGYTGEILLDNRNIQNYRTEFLRRNIICISQKPFIFNGTILENILINNNTPSKDELDNVIKMVCLEDDIKNMANGLNTLVGEKGVALSGGQAQKIALARIFLAKQPIIILDEPTSALDMNAEKVICKNIYSFLRSKTIIAVTHRKTILEYCSKIYEINDRKITVKPQ